MFHIANIIKSILKDNYLYTAFYTIYRNSRWIKNTNVKNTTKRENDTKISYDLKIGEDFLNKTHTQCTNHK